MAIKEPESGGLDLLSALVCRDWYPPAVHDLIEQCLAAAAGLSTAYHEYKPLLGEPLPGNPDFSIVPVGPILAEALEALRPPRARTPSLSYLRKDARLHLRELGLEFDRRRDELLPWLKMFLRHGRAPHGFVGFSGPHGTPKGRTIVARSFWSFPDLTWHWNKLTVETSGERLINLLVYRAEAVDAWNCRADSSPDVTGLTILAVQPHMPALTPPPPASASFETSSNSIDASPPAAPLQSALQVLAQSAAGVSAARRVEAAIVDFEDALKKEGKTLSEKMEEPGGRAALIRIIAENEETLEATVARYLRVYLTNKGIPPSSQGKSKRLHR